MRFYNRALTASEVQNNFNADNTATPPIPTPSPTPTASPTPTPTLAATFYVNSTADTPDVNTADNICDVDATTSGSQCTLRAALMQANASPGINSILFNIPGAGPQRINTSTQLPGLSEPAIIDGYSQPGASVNTLAAGSNAVLMIEVHGTGVGSGSGIDINTSDSRVRGLVINGFQYNGVTINGANNTVEGNFIGTDVSGAAATSPNLTGIEIMSGTASSVGGLMPAMRNVISGNNGNGVSVGGGTSGNWVLGNLIGTNAAGTAGLPQPNWATGVNLASSNGNHIGDTAPGAGNVISGNSGVGIWLGNTWPGGTPGSSGNFVQGNLVGTNASGQAVIANGGALAINDGSANNLVGGNTPAARNIFVGGQVTIRSASTKNRVQGNYVGLLRDGTAPPRPTEWYAGIAINSADGNIIGGSGAGEGNVVSGNSGPGIWLADSGAGTPGSNENLIQGNRIGTTPDGLSAAANYNGGIQLISGSSGNTIGGATPAARNIIAGNKGGCLNDECGDGISISNWQGQSNNNVVRNNYVGVNLAGVELKNTGSAITLWGVANTQITDNVISGSLGSGVSIGSASPTNGDASTHLPSTNTLVQNNRIGTNPAGTAIAGHRYSAVSINSSHNNQIAGNLISGSGTGISISNQWNNPAGSKGNVIRGNLIGTNFDGTAAIPNGSGVTISGGSSSNVIGGGSATDRNVVSGNNGQGVNINNSGGNCENNSIQNNYIGVRANGSAALPNTNGPGIALYGVSGTQVVGNTISGNSGGGMHIWGGSIAQNQPIIGTTLTSVRGNFIGTDPTGMFAIPNGETGVGLLIGSLANNNTIGGPSPADRNVVSGNNSDGFNLGVFNGVASNNLIQGNYIGVNAAGTAQLSNKGNGIASFGASGTRILGNVISGSGSAGINLSMGSLNAIAIATNGTIVQGNFVGTDAGGRVPFQNFNSGVQLAGATNTLITGNLISGNRLNGINLINTVVTSNGTTTLAVPTGNIIQSNRIGVQADGISPLPNTTNGIAVAGNSNTIGGEGAGQGNIVAYNGNFGVLIYCQSLSGATSFVRCGTGNSILSNSIYSNVNIGINLAGFGGATPAVANNNQSSPVLIFNGGTSGKGTLSSLPSTQHRIEFFANDECDPSGAGEGQTFVGSTQATTDESGSASFAVSSLTAVAAGKFITATATGPNGTSRFSQCLVSAPSTGTISGRATDSSGNAIAGATIKLTGGQTSTVTTDGAGNYTFPNLPSDQSYTVTATAIGVTFYPASYTLQSLPKNRTINFTRASVRYALTDLGALAPQATNSIGWDVNEAGMVAGWSSTAGFLRPFIYRDGALTSLGTLPNGSNALAIAINSNGRSVGYSDVQLNPNSFANRGFFVDGAGPLKEIGTLGGTASQAWGVNDSGAVVGQAQLTNGQTRPFLWRDANDDGQWQSSEMLDLGALNGGTFGRGFAISNSGVVVGNSSNGAGGPQVATLWRDDNNNGQSDAGELRSLGNLGGVNSQASGINDASYVVGFSDITALSTGGRPQQRAFIWHDDNGNGRADEGEMKDMGTLGGEFSQALRINSAGEAIGWSDVVGINTAHAFIYRRGFMADLNAMIPQGSGWTLIEARGISDDGKIVGYGLYNGQQRAYLLTPVANTQTEQTISFDAPSNKIYGDAPFTLGATSSSGLPVSFEVVSGPATINGGTLTINGAGIVTVRATQSGDDSFYAAPAIERSFVVAKATPVINWSNPADINVGTPLGAQQLNATASFKGAPLAGAFAYTPTTGVVLPNGTHTLSAEFTPNDAANFTKAKASVTQNVGYRICVLYDETKVNKSGSTVPIKLQLCDASGRNLSSSSIVVHAIGLALVSQTTYGPVEDAGNANADGNFRLTGDTYTFNLKTTGLTSGTYDLYFTAGSDPVTHTVRFQVK